jgi:SAM-dependent methyltransferase
VTTKDIKSNNKKIQQEQYSKGDYTSWYDHVYQNAAGNEEDVPWAKSQPNSHLLAMLARTDLQGNGKKAAVVGCGLGDDAEELSRRGFEVTGFDLAPTAIQWCKKRFPQSKVDYQVADLLLMPPKWQRAFDFVVEAHTLQSLPLQIRQDALGGIARLLKKDGEIYVICFGRREDQPAGDGPPWMLAKSEIMKFKNWGLVLEHQEIVMEKKGHRPGKRFRMQFRQTS